MTLRELADFEADQREMENNHWYEAETASEARERMNPAEVEADLQFAQQAQWQPPHPGRVARARRLKRRAQRGGARRAE